MELEGIKIVKVKQPWALHLVRGIKDCENRTWRTTGWVAIASSKARPTKKLWSALAERTRHVLNYQAIPRSEYEYQHILGMIKVQCCEPDRLPWPTVWHNKPDYAWMVQEAWEFEKPIPLAKDDKFQTCVRLTKRPAYKEQIARLLLLKPT